MPPTRTSRKKDGNTDVPKPPPNCFIRFRSYLWQKRQAEHGANFMPCNKFSQVMAGPEWNAIKDTAEALPFKLEADRALQEYRRQYPPKSKRSSQTSARKGKSTKKGKAKDVRDSASVPSTAPDMPPSHPSGLPVVSAADASIYFSQDSPYYVHPTSSAYALPTDPLRFQHALGPPSENPFTSQPWQEFAQGGSYFQDPGPDMRLRDSGFLPGPSLAQLNPQGYPYPGEWQGMTVTGGPSWAVASMHAQGSAYAPSPAYMAMPAYMSTYEYAPQTAYASQSVYASQPEYAAQYTSQSAYASQSAYDWQYTSASMFTPTPASASDNHIIEDASSPQPEPF